MIAVLVCKALQSWSPCHPERGPSAGGAGGELHSGVVRLSLPPSPPQSSLVLLMSFQATLPLCPRAFQSQHSSLSLVSFYSFLDAQPSRERVVPASRGVRWTTNPTCCAGEELFLVQPLTLKWSTVTKQNPFPWYSHAKVTPFPGGSSVPWSGFQKAFSVSANTPPHLALIPRMTRLLVHTGSFKWPVLLSLKKWLHGVLISKDHNVNVKSDIHIPRTNGQEIIIFKKGETTTMTLLLPMWKALYTVQGYHI